MAPPVGLRRSVRLQKEGEQKKLEISTLTRMFTQMADKDASHRAAMNLRATCRALKGKIESREFMWPFLAYLGIDATREPWARRLQTESWISLCNEWATAPLTIATLDYSNSMHDAAMDGRTHLSVAKEILTELFIEQQTKLRSDLNVYLFARGRRHVHLKEMNDLADLYDRMDQRQFCILRDAARLNSVFSHLISAYSPIHTVSMKQVVVKVISDHDLKDKVIDWCMDILCSTAEKKSLGNRQFTIEYIPTLVGEVAEATYTFSQIMLEKKRRHSHVKLALNNQHAAKRLRYEPNGG
jgi:hypothetical protein